MTDHPCSCSTCINDNCPYWTYLIQTYGSSHPRLSELQMYRESLTKRCGCIAHPQARKYLMKDVIERLTSAIKTCDNPEQESAYEYAIDTIKSGGK